MTEKKLKKGIPLEGGEFPLINVSDIEIVERPTTGDDKKLFFNPRDLDSFTPECMTSLRMSIRADGLQQPPTVRAFRDNGSVFKIELVAGERRYRSLKQIVDEDLPCFDRKLAKPTKFKAEQIVVYRGMFGKVVSQKGEIVQIQILDSDDKPTEEQREVAYKDVRPTSPGSKVYGKIPCMVHMDIDDAHALRLAFGENDKKKSLSTREEIRLVERLQTLGYKVKEIAELLGSNDTWVSQTANFTNDLPKEALACLLRNDMKRHTAVKIMEYSLKDRQRLWKSTVEAEAEETANKLEEARSESESAEDQQLLALSEEKNAKRLGDLTAAGKAKKKADRFAKQADAAKAKKDKAESERGQIKTSHVQAGASAAGLSPRKAKLLVREDIQKLYVDDMECYLEGDEVDPLCGDFVPGSLVDIVRRTAVAILSGQRDPLAIIRSHMVDNGDWELKTRGKKKRRDDDDDEDDGDDDDDEEMEFDPSEEDIDSLDTEFAEEDDDFVPTMNSRRRGPRDDEDY